MDWSGAKTGPLLWEAGDRQPKTWDKIQLCWLRDLIFVLLCIFTQIIRGFDNTGRPAFYFIILILVYLTINILPMSFKLHRTNLHQYLPKFYLLVMHVKLSPYSSVGFCATVVTSNLLEYWWMRVNREDFSRELGCVCHPQGRIMIMC
jgi:hypothetical protein